jgi:hypothetical protein
LKSFYIFKIWKKKKNCIWLGQFNDWFEPWFFKFLWKMSNNRLITAGSFLVLSWKPPVGYFNCLELMNSDFFVFFLKYPELPVLWLWMFFSNTRNCRFFDCGCFFQYPELPVLWLWMFFFVFHVPGNWGFVCVDCFKYPEPVGIKKFKYPPPRPSPRKKSQTRLFSPGKKIHKHRRARIVLQLIKKKKIKYFSQSIL